MMKQLILKIATISTAGFSGLAGAHGFHDHSGIYHAGEFHAAGGFEPLMIMLLLSAGIYLAFSLFRK